MSVVDPGGYAVYFDGCGGGQDDLVRSFPPGLKCLRPMSLDEDPVRRAELVGCRRWSCLIQVLQFRPNPFVGPAAGRSVFSDLLTRRLMGLEGLSRRAPICCAQISRHPPPPLPKTTTRVQSQSQTARVVYYEFEPGPPRTRCR